MRKLFVLLALFIIPTVGQATHVVTATFNYDFTADNACSTTVVTSCVKQFNVYDITTGSAVKLFSVIAPSGANGPITGIKGSSGSLTIKGGTHTFSITVVMADGTETASTGAGACTTTASVTPAQPTSFVVTAA
jgi:hypothetical protein